MRSRYHDGRKYFSKSFSISNYGGIEATYKAATEFIDQYCADHPEERVPKGIKAKAEKGSKSEVLGVTKCERWDIGRFSFPEGHMRRNDEKGFGLKFYDLNEMVNYR